MLQTKSVIEGICSVISSSLFICLSTVERDPDPRFFVMSRKKRKCASQQYKTIYVIQLYLTPRGKGTIISKSRVQ